MNDSPGDEDDGVDTESEVEKKIISNTNFAFLLSGAFTGKS